MTPATTIALGLWLMLGPRLLFPQPGVANRCVIWGTVRLADGSLSYRFAPEPIPAGPHYLHYIVMLNEQEQKILTELAPKWSPSEDVNIPGNGFYGCELGNFEGPEIKPGDRVQVIVTDEGAGQQGVAEAVIPELPGAINCDVQLRPAPTSVPSLALRPRPTGKLALHWETPAATTLVYQRSRKDRYGNGRPRGQYRLVARLTGGETSFEPDDTADMAWLIVQIDREGQIVGRSQEVRMFPEPDGFESLIAVTDSSVIYTVDVGAGLVTVRDNQGREMRHFLMKDDFVAQAMEADGENLAIYGRPVTDERGWIRLLYSSEGRLLDERAAPAPSTPTAEAEGALIRAVRATSRGPLLLDGLAKELRSSHSGHKSETFRGLAFGGFKRPRDFAVGTDGTTYVLDGPRIVVVPPGLEEEMPSLNRKGDVYVIRWRTGVPTESLVSVRGQGQELSLGGGRPTRRHQVPISTPSRPGKYRVSVSHSIRILGEEPTWASVPLLIPPLTKGSHAYLQVRVAIVILANVVQRKNAPQDIELPGPVDDVEIERLKQEMLIGQRFYWINSHLRFLPDMEFIVDREFHDLNPYEDAPNRQNLSALFAREGKKLDDYAGVCRIVVEQVYDANAKAWRIASSGGGLTSGLSKGSRDPGWSWWPAGAADFFIPDSWLFVHEYGHQVDAMFDASGEPSFWGNHFAPQEGNVARFGEHFDGNAYLLRWWPEEKWFTSDWGTVEFAKDADEDGVPDDAPELPIDEKRLSGDPHRKDTDGDGLSDRDELMAWKGITVGLGQVWANPIEPNLRSRDTDGDGLADGRDPYPLCAFNTLIPRRRELPKQTTTGSMPQGEYSLQVGSSRAGVSVIWDPEYLWITMTGAQPCRLLVQLDANNDGWFVGKDNYQLTIDPPTAEGEAPKVHLYIVNAAEPDRWPFNDENLVSAQEIRLERAAGEGELRVGIPHNEATGLTLEKNERLGINIGVARPSGPHVYHMVGQPHELLEVELVDG